MKVLLPIDDSRCSEAATQSLLQQFRPENAELCVLHVVEPLLLIPYPYVAQVETLQAAQEERLKEANELVRRTEEQLVKAGFQVQTAVEEGDPRSVILDYAARWNADLIVIGSHGRKGLDRFLLGSVAESVARHAHCSVQIVRSRGTRGA
jgi:nucleotide-binding universal stress UspA family protein